jgi:Na+:H+ antiporter, NhaA family
MNGDKENWEEAQLPRAPIAIIVSPVRRFLHVEAASGVVLLLAAAAALVMANSPFSRWYLNLWATPVGIRFGELHFSLSLKQFINDALMAIFFFVVGLEIKRELVLGELRELRRAALPVLAAAGGMIVPAALFLLVEGGRAGAHGWGIPVATDIAFVVGCMAVLGRRVPHGLRVMLLALAIADDIGAILVIAVGYSQELSLGWLAAAGAGFAVILGLERLGVRAIGVYAILAVSIWFAFHESGVHATVAGVILGLMTPARSLISTNAFMQLMERTMAGLTGQGVPSEKHQVRRVQEVRNAAREVISPLEFMIDALHPWVSFVIMPLFALANAGVHFEIGDFGSPLCAAVMLGLVVGKPVGILLASWAAVKSGLCLLPTRVGWGQLAAGGMLAGIGFTMSLFIAELALAAPMLNAAKLGVLAGSMLSAALAMAVFAALPRKESQI